MSDQTFSEAYDTLALMRSIHTGVGVATGHIRHGYDIREDHPPVDIHQLSLEEARRLGFQRWSADTNLYLAPHWLLDYLPDTFDAYTIGALESMDLIEAAMAESPHPATKLRPYTQPIYNHDPTDHDSRFGLCSFGLVFKDDGEG